RPHGIIQVSSSWIVPHLCPPELGDDPFSSANHQEARFMSPFFWSRLFRSLSDGTMARSKKTRKARPALEALEHRITPATRTWTGGAALNDWSLAATWSANQVPVNGDLLIFPDSLPATESRTLNNDLTNLAPGAITFANNSSANAYTLGGNSITLGGSSDANTL